MNSSQRIFLMPGATEGYGTESQLIQKANDIYTYAQTDPLVVGVFPFDWYSDTYVCVSAEVFCGNGVPGTNQALGINSGTNANEWFVGPLPVDEWAVGARFRLVAFSPLGKENLVCLTTHSTPLS